MPSQSEIHTEHQFRVNGMTATLQWAMKLIPGITHSLSGAWVELHPGENSKISVVVDWMLNQWPL